METKTVLRLAGASAALGGALRIAAAFIPPAASPELEVLYLIIDTALLFGLFGVYASEHRRIGWVGLAGFVVAAIGQASIVGPDSDYAGVNIYATASAVIGVGLGIMSVPMLLSGRFPRFIPAIWIGSLLVGLGSAVLPGRPMVAFFLAGLLFALGFLAAGIFLVSKPAD